MFLSFKSKLIQVYIRIRNLLPGQKYFIFKILLYIPLYILLLPIILLIRLIRPFILIRFGELMSSRIGHLAANTELYLCEKEASINRPNIFYIDIFYTSHLPICNDYLLNKWRQIINIWPRWLIYPLNVLNKIIPFGESHKIGNNLSHDRDILNLLDKYPQHLKFTSQEETLGVESLNAMGISRDSKFICLLVRDDAYLNMHLKNINTAYHTYRDCNIDNYFLVADELTKKGYYVIRMGVNVNSTFNNGNPMIIDYANNGFRSEFLDIYLGAHCDFCISTSAGWDAIPLIFRRPIVYAPVTPLGYIFSFSDRYSAITKHHFDISEKRELTFSEIFERGVGFCLRSEDYTNKGVELIENTAEEIRDLVIEFVDKDNNCWISESNDEYLQELFWKKFPVNANDIFGTKLHGEIKASFGTKFLRQNVNLLK
jgi:putative glycosyltransferase (TIGR04372 family)